MDPYYQRQMFLRNLQLMNLAEEAEIEQTEEPEELALGGILPDDYKTVMNQIGYTDVKMPHLKVKPLPTLSGFSSGGYKTSYILSNLPQSFGGFGIFSGSYGDIQKTHFFDATEVKFKGSSVWHTFR